MAAVDAHVVRRTGDISVELSEFMLNKLSLISVRRVLESLKPETDRGLLVCGFHIREFGWRYHVLR